MNLPFSSCLMLLSKYFTNKKLSNSFQRLNVFLPACDENSVKKAIVSSFEFSNKFSAFSSVRRRSATHLVDYVIEEAGVVEIAQRLTIEMGG